MERKVSSSAGSAIIVQTEIVVHTDENANETLNLSRASSVRSICRSMSGGRQEGRPTEQLDEGGESVSRSRRLVSFSRSGDDDFQNGVENHSPDSGFRDLIEFLKKTPPPTNYMSIPDSFSSSEDDKWHKLKVSVLRQRRRARKRRPPVIKLPDSAVAATTIDGHRHIAISIPIEYSHLEPPPSSQYPVYDSIGAAVHREVESQLGTWRNLPSDRLVTVLNPVAEDRESLSSISLSPMASPRPEQITILSVPPRRPRPHSVSLLPSQEQRYTPRRARDLAKRRSTGNALLTSQTLFDPTATLQSSRGQRISRPATTETSVPGPSARRDHTVIQTAQMLPTRSSMTGLEQRESGQQRDKVTTNPDVAAQIHSKQTGAVTTTDDLVLGQPTITLTVPSRNSSKRVNTNKATANETIDSLISSPRSSSSGNGTGSGSGNGNSHHSEARRPRGSFAESLVTTNSSPQLFKAQTATAHQPVPIVVHPSGIEVESPLNLSFPAPPLEEEKIDRAIQTSPLPPPIPPRAERSQSRKERVRERKQRDMEKLKAQMEQNEAGPGELLDPHDKSGRTSPESPVIGKLSEMGSPSALRPTSTEKEGEEAQSYSFIPGMPAILPKILPSAILGKYDQKSIRSPPSSSPLMPSSPKSLGHTWERGSDRTSYNRRKERQAEREERELRRARYIAKALAEEKEVLERLSREELLERYEALRETRIYEMDKRLRKLERNRDRWVRTVPFLLETLNNLLQEQQNLLQGARLTYTVPPTTSRSSHQQQRRRPQSAEVSSSSSLQTGQSLDPLEEPRRSQSLHSSSESRSNLHLGRDTSGLRGGGGELVATPPAEHSSSLKNKIEEGLKDAIDDENTQSKTRAKAKQQKKRESTETAPLTVTTPTGGDAGYYSTRSGDSNC
ncbi:hypothetical protein F5Y19DRAFT_419560 [Xylariaceae sp. FL1651]|nr:hypothetical protein F5Y19DRAFT_419560 [Xylariaceae sp. FL1651]